MDRKGLGLLVSILALMLALGGCGGEDGDSGDAESWAASVCSNLSEWVTDIEGAVTSVTEEGLGVDEDTLRDAVDQAKDATDELTDDLGELGTPDVEAGDQAKEELDKLREQLQDQSDQVEQALDDDSGPLEVATAVGTALSAASSQLKESFENLQGVNPGGELEDGFRDADDCDSLREQVEDIGS